MPVQIVHLEKATKEGKKYSAILNDGRRINFGSNISQTYAEGATKQKRDAYFKRHLANKTEYHLIKNMIPSPALLSAIVLWLTPSLSNNLKLLNRAWVEKQSLLPSILLERE